MLHDSAAQCENLSVEQAYLVSKFLLISEQLLENGLLELAPRGMTSVNRQLAKILHPDKNPHPQAKEAFQRVQHAMETVKARIPAQSSTAPEAACNKGNHPFSNFFF